MRPRASSAVRRLMNRLQGARHRQAPCKNKGDGYGLDAEARAT